MKFRKNRKFTQEEKDEIIAYAKEHGIWSVKEQFGVWPETVRYWIDPSLRKKVKQKQEARHSAIKNDKEYIARQKEYREYRQKNGIARKKYNEWKSTLTPEQLKKRVESIKQHRLDNLEHYKQKSRELYLKDKAAGKHRKKYNEDPLHKMKCNIREHIRQAVKYNNVAKNHSSIDYLGCTIEEFKIHIENQFREGMSWDNHGRGEDCWHLDHIIPLASLKECTTDNLKKICHYTNYQPLWEKENLQKQDKIL